MPKYLIEREVPGAGQLTSADLHGIAVKSCGVLRDMGPEIQWVHSYVTGDRITCLYIAPDEASILEHGRRGGFPVTRVMQVEAVIDPVT